MPRLTAGTDTLLFKESYENHGWWEVCYRGYGNVIGMISNDEMLCLALYIHHMFTAENAPFVSLVKGYEEKLKERVDDYKKEPTVRDELYEKISTAEKVRKLMTDKGNKSRLIEGKIEGYKDCLRIMNQPIPPSDES